jgi:hypothetical protein
MSDAPSSDEGYIDYLEGIVETSRQERDTMSGLLEIAKARIAELDRTIRYISSHLSEVQEHET